ncbi:MAG: endolytic transglycosylase MltG [Chloroflexota bacterium]
MPGARRSRLGLVVSLLMLAVLCGLLLGAVFILFSLPAEVEARFGPPSPSLSPVQQMLLGAYLLARAAALDQPAGSTPGLVEIEVAEGETAGEVIARLRASGIINDAFLLRAYLRYRGLDVGIEAGRYRLSGEMTVRGLAEALQTARPLEIQLTVVEGWRLEQIAAAMPSSGLETSSQDFLAAARSRPDGYSFTPFLPDPPSLEGFLFPDTYHLRPEASAGDLVRAMLDNFERRVGDDFRQRFDQHGLTLYQAVILASIVEREAAVAEERPLIASVFLNRLAVGMHLDADPTVQYALGLQPDGIWWKSPLSSIDLEIDSPYNTYRYPGLPPTPIANPGLASLQAVAFPAESPYYYFRALCDSSGRHAFAVTFEEHLQNACP